MPRLGVGKLPIELLARLLGEAPAEDARVILGPGVGRDCAALDMGDGRVLVATSDPITFATDEIGWYAVQVNANDIATTGAVPRWLLVTILLPEATADEALAERVFRQVGQACAEIGVTLVGGHTEVTHGLERPIVSGTMLGEVAREALVLPTGARLGDRLILTKRLAVEATSILAREARAALAGRVPEATLDRARRFLHDPGIGVLREARAALASGRVHAMHDPTEGGLATALREMATAGGVGLEIDGEAVGVYPETEAVCAPFGIDPWGVIASGSLLLAVDPADADAIVSGIERSGIEANVIGRVVAGGDGVTVRAEGARAPLRTFARDEIVKAFADGPAPGPAR